MSEERPYCVVGRWASQPGGGKASLLQGSRACGLGSSWGSDLSLRNFAHADRCSLLSPWNLSSPHSGAPDRFPWPWVGGWLGWHPPRRPSKSLVITVMITTPSHSRIMRFSPYSPFIWNLKQTMKKDILAGEHRPGLQAGYSPFTTACAAPGTWEVLNKHLSSFTPSVGTGFQHLCRKQAAPLVLLSWSLFSVLCAQWPHVSARVEAVAKPTCIYNYWVQGWKQSGFFSLFRFPGFNLVSHEKLNKYTLSFLLSFFE